MSGRSDPGGAPRDTSSAPRQNAIWIFGDQHRAQALSCAGDPNLATPNLDRMATEGVNFTHAAAGFPLCCPYRGSLLTGRYPHECVPGHEHRMPPEMPTVAHAFKEQGYHTAYFGKWHLDGWRSILIEELGGRPEGFTDGTSLKPLAGPTRPALPGYERA